MKISAYHASPTTLKFNDKAVRYDAHADSLPCGSFPSDVRYPTRRERLVPALNPSTCGPNSPWGASWGPREPPRTRYAGAARRGTKIECARVLFPAYGNRDSGSRSELRWEKDCTAGANVEPAYVLAAAMSAKCEQHSSLIRLAGQERIAKRQRPASPRCRLLL